MTFNSRAAYLVSVFSKPSVLSCYPFKIITYLTSRKAISVIHMESWDLNYLKFTEILDDSTTEGPAAERQIPAGGSPQAGKRRDPPSAGSSRETRALPQQRRPPPPLPPRPRVAPQFAREGPRHPPGSRGAFRRRPGPPWRGFAVGGIPPGWKPRPPRSPGWMWQPGQSSHKSVQPSRPQAAGRAGAFHW